MKFSFDWPSRFSKEHLLPLPMIAYESSTYTLGLISQAVSEKMFENNGHIHK